MSNPKQEKLNLAAQALAEAACLSADSIAQKKLADKLDSLQTCFETGVKDIVEAQKDSSQNLLQNSANLLKTLNENIMKLIQRTEESNNLLQKAEKTNKIQVAMQRCDKGNFQYHETGHLRSSSILVKEILESFFCGQGMFLPDDASLKYSYGERTNAEKAEFRTKLVAQMELVLGHKPRVELHSSGKYAIYY